MPMSPAAPRSARANFNEVIRVLRRASAYVRTVKNGLFERFLTSPCIFRHTLKLKNTIFTKVYTKYITLHKKGPPASLARREVADARRGEDAARDVQKYGERSMGPRNDVDAVYPEG